MKKPTWTLLTALMAALAILLALMLPTQAVQAAGPFTVTTTADSHDAAPGNGVCANAGGFCSLRAAIEEANASVTPTTITLPAGTYNLTLGVLDVAPNGNRTIVITGAGPANTIIQQTDNFNRVMAIDYNVMGNTNVSISGVTLTGGRDASDHFGGAGILAGNVYAPPDSLTLSNCIVSNNNVAALDVMQAGGGVRMDGGILTVTNCTFTNNSSGLAPGGAIAFFNPGAQGTLTITGSTFTNNRLTNTTSSGPSGGGAIFIENAAATISNSTFTANQATSLAAGGAHGGAVYFNTGTLTIDHPTLPGHPSS
ncbi:CSLREA domain-containing protein, partial [bacterium]